MWFWAIFNEVRLSENSTDTKMFSETRREHSKDQRTLGRQVSLQTYCVTMILAHKRGTKPLAGELSSVTKGRMGPGIQRYSKEKFSQVLWVLREGEEQFSISHFSCQHLEPPLVHLTHALSLSDSEKAT